MWILNDLLCQYVALFTQYLQSAIRQTVFNFQWIYRFMHCFNLPLFIIKLINQIIPYQETYICVVSNDIYQYLTINSSTEYKIALLHTQLKLINHEIRGNVPKHNGSWWSNNFRFNEVSWYTPEAVSNLWLSGHHVSVRLAIGYIILTTEALIWPIMQSAGL